jgi:hypothetical protein
MTQFSSMTKQEIGRRFTRLPFVMLLTLGLLFSLLHCTGCGPALAKSDSASVLSSADSGSAPETPEQMLPCHSGHCLSHVNAQHVTAAVTSADQTVRRLVSGREQFPATLAGLPLFKPPRA